MFQGFVVATNLTATSLEHLFLRVQGLQLAPVECQGRKVEVKKKKTRHVQCNDMTWPVHRAFDRDDELWQADQHLPEQLAAASQVPMERHAAIDTWTSI